MKRHIYKLNFLLIAAIVAITWSCAEQDVAPIESPDDNPIVTIEPRASYSSASENDTLWFDITVDKAVRQGIDFAPVFAEGSAASAADVEIINGTLNPYTFAADIGIRFTTDGVAEGIESAVFEINASADLGYNFQLNPASDSESVSVDVTSFDYTLDWSTGMYEEMDMCEWGIDLDIYMLNAGGTAGDFSGATGACPLEVGTTMRLADDTYDVYIDYYDGDITADAGVEIPYTATISVSSGEAVVINGTFNSDDIGESRVVGTMTVADGVYTFNAN